MKKFLALLMALILIVCCFVACGKKTEVPADNDNQAETSVNQENETTTEQDETTTEPVEAEGDPVEYGREYWEEKYPGENICPFSIDENGTEYSYYWISGFDGWDGTMESWIKQPFNWNGWHKTDDGCIVNEDETLKITDNWANGEESMSSFCTVTTEKYEKPAADNQ